jgi:hypothetical protein
MRQPHVGKKKKKPSLLRSLIMVKRWQQKAVNKKEWVPVINEAMGACN